MGKLTSRMVKEFCGTRQGAGSGIALRSGFPAKLKDNKDDETGRKRKEGEGISFLTLY